MANVDKLLQSARHVFYRFGHRACADGYWECPERLFEQLADKTFESPCCAIPIWRGKLFLMGLEVRPTESAEKLSLVFKIEVE